MNASHSPSGPEIHLWYGSPIRFGLQGMPQQQINILGCITQMQAGEMPDLIYTLNGSPEVRLRIEDAPRLTRPGDFNIEIHNDDPYLRIGENHLRLSVGSGYSNLSTEMTFIYKPLEALALPHMVDWSQPLPLTDQAQVVDGWWQKVPGGVRPVEIGYDRVLAIGDMNWENYCATVPVTIHGTTSRDEGGVGIAIRWRGHVNINGETPHAGWWSIGAYGYFRFRASGNRFVLRLNRSEPSDIERGEMAFERNYIFKISAQNTPGETGGFYRFKAWQADQPEPDGWLLTARDGADDLERGALLLIAHKVDATFGNVCIEPLDPLPQFRPVGTGQKD